MVAAKFETQLPTRKRKRVNQANLHSSPGSLLAHDNDKQNNNGSNLSPLPLQASYSNNQLTLKFDDQSLIERYLHEPPSLILHLYPTFFKFGHKDGFFSYKSHFKNFLVCIKDKQLPSDFLDVINEAKCQYYEGCLIVEIHDYRQPKNRNTDTTQISGTQIKRVVMRPTAESIWTDIQLMNEEWNSPWTVELALELEAQILLKTEEPLCLDPSISVSRISNALELATGKRLDKKKQKWNSLEREQIQAQKKENNKLMAILDTRSRRSLPFEPNFYAVSFLQIWRANKQKSDSNATPAIEVKKVKNKKIVIEPPPLNDGRKCVRTIRFNRSEGTDKRVYTVVNLYVLDGSYDGVFRWGTTYNTSLNGGNIEFKLGPKYLMEAYVVQLKTAYGYFNKLICDNNLENPVSCTLSITARIDAATAAQQQHMMQLQTASDLQQQQTCVTKRAVTLIPQQQHQQHQQTITNKTKSVTSLPVVVQESAVEASQIPTPLLSDEMMENVTQQYLVASQYPLQQPVAVQHAFPISTEEFYNQRCAPYSNQSPSLSTLQQSVNDNVLNCNRPYHQQVTSLVALRQRIQQLISGGLMSLPTAQKLVSQLSNPNTSAISQYRLQQFFHLHQQQAMLNSQIQLQPQNQIQQPQIQQIQPLTETTPHPSLARQTWMAIEKQPGTSPAMPPSNVASLTFSQLNSQHQQQMTAILMRRHQILNQARLGLIAQDQVATRIQQLQAAYNIAHQQHYELQQAQQQRQTQRITNRMFQQYVRHISNLQQPSNHQVQHSTIPQGSTELQPLLHTLPQQAHYNIPEMQESNATPTTALHTLMQQRATGRESMRARGNETGQTPYTAEQMVTVQVMRQREALQAKMRRQMGGQVDTIDAASFNGAAMQDPNENVVVAQPSQPSASGTYQVFNIQQIQ